MNVEKWKSYIICLICALGIFFAMPNLFNDKTLDSMPSWFPKNKVPLGLDLQGGSHLLLEVDMNVVNKDFIDQIASLTIEMLKNAKINASIANSLTPEDREINIRLDKNLDKSYVDKLIKQIDPDLDFKLEGNKIVIIVTDAALDKRHEEVVNRSLEIVRKRIDEEGTKEPIIQRHGSNRIILQMPGIQDPSKVKELLGRTAKMTFQVVDDTLPEIYEGDVRRAKIGVIYLPLTSSPNEPQRFLPINRKVLINGDALVDANPTYDSYNNPQVAFRFNAVGAKQFAKVTKKYVNKRLAIVLDNKVISAPQIKEAIVGGSGVINGSFSIEEANDLSLLLRSGALPAPLITIEERTVGPDLGGDSIKIGCYATLISIISVFAFMLLEYRFFGLIADIALLFNIIILIAGLSLLQATLTLPGIAGIALTVGMAVDANVLINERAREEQKKGVKPIQALSNGYKIAMRTIVDSNVTTLFGAIALYCFGTGSVRGFAVTLTMGIMISFFTAVYLTKFIKSFWIQKKQGSEIILP